MQASLKEKEKHINKKNLMSKAFLHNNINNKVQEKCAKQKHILRWQHAKDDAGEIKRAKRTGKSCW